MTTPIVSPPSPAAAPPPPTNGHTLRAQGAAVAFRVVRRFVYPAEAPFTSITLYYALLVLLAWLAYTYVPGAAVAFGGERLSEIMNSGGGLMDNAAPVAPGAAFSTRFAVLLGVAMVGAFLLMIPVSWVYMATRQKKGSDQTVTQTILLLALTVAGVIVIVRNSVALAFSLAGIVGAIRYRNNLPETRDTLYIFLAIGVGLAAGVEALPAALALSMVFSYVVLAIMKADYGMCELGRSSTHLLVSGKNGAAAPANGKEPVKKARNDFNAVLVVRARHAETGRPPVESLLSRETKRWKLVEVESNEQAKLVHLKYLIRLGRKKDREDLEDAILDVGQPHVIGARIH